MAVTAVERALKDGIEPVYIVLGTAAPLVEQARIAVEAAVRPSIGLPAFNHGRYRGSDPGAEAAFVAARTLPMMADRRLVELRDLELAPSEVFEALVAYLADPCPTTVLLVTGAGFPKVEKGGSNWGARVRGAMKKSRGVLITLGAEDAQPGPFAVEAAARAGKRLGKREAELLIELVGPDLGRLEQEVQKLALFVGDAEEIDADAIVAASSMVAEAVIWDLTAGLAARDADLALGALYRLQGSGEDPHKLLGMIVWQMRELLRVAELVAVGANDKQITSKVRIRWDQLRKVRPIMASGGFPHAADLLRRLATANRHMNSHRAGSARILEGLVLEMLGGRLRRPPPVPRAR